MPTFQVPTRHREQFVGITAEVQAAVSALGLQDGLCHVFSPHTTAGVTVNENSDPDVPADMLTWFRSAIPQDGGFRHGEGNADAHIKTSLVGCYQIVPVSNGRLDLGRWQAVFLCEFDGPRTLRAPQGARGPGTLAGSFARTVKVTGVGSNLP